MPVMLGLLYYTVLANLGIALLGNNRFETSKSCHDPKHFLYSGIHLTFLQVFRIPHLVRSALEFYTL